MDFMDFITTFLILVGATFGSIVVALVVFLHLLHSADKWKREDQEHAARDSSGWSPINRRDID